jgi:hypothetical protein
MNKKLVYQLLIFVIPVLVMIWTKSCKTLSGKMQETEIIITNPEGKGFLVELEFLKGKAHHYPLMAVWIEDIQGNYLQTLFVAKSVARGEFQHAKATEGQWESGPLRRAATLPYWAHKNNTKEGREDIYPSPESPVPDVYSGATPKSNFILQSKTDQKMNKPFRVWFEINQFFDFNNFWTNNKFPEDQDYKTSGQPALLYVSDPVDPSKLPENLSLRLVGHSHFSGQNGNFYTSLETISSAKRIVSSISIKVSR